MQVCIRRAIMKRQKSKLYKTYKKIRIDYLVFGKFGVWREIHNLWIEIDLIAEF